MRRVRIIPVLTVDGSKLVKTVKFKKPNYLGDPINAIKIFNDKEVDEVVVLDITASKNNKDINFQLVEEMAGECFMPLAYGGGVKTFDHIQKLFSIGVEKVILNSVLETNIDLITKVANHYGAQSTVVALDIKKNIWGTPKVHFRSGKKSSNIKPIDFAQKVESAGAGEILINNIDRDGTFKGLDMELINSIATSVNIPVIACGGAHSIENIKDGIVCGGASAVAAGSLFAYKANNTASILINYPSQEELHKEVFKHLS